MRNRFLSVIIMTTIAAVSVAACNLESGPTVDSEERRETYLVLVNEDHEVPENWKSRVQIYEIENSYGKKLYLEEEASEQFQELQGDLLGKGIQIEAENAFRSNQEQQQDNEDLETEYGKEYVEKYSDPPGYSEHNTGLAIDVFLIVKGHEIRNKDDMIDARADFAEVFDVLPEYGFILRYPEDKEDKTGHPYEPWHLRYIGDTEIAAKIMNQGITLEDYLGE